MKPFCIDARIEECRCYILNIWYLILLYGREHPEPAEFFCNGVTEENKVVRVEVRLLTVCTNKVKLTFKFMNADLDMIGLFERSDNLRSNKCGYSVPNRRKTKMCESIHMTSASEAQGSR